MLVLGLVGFFCVGGSGCMQRGFRFFTAGGKFVGSTFGGALGGATVSKYAGARLCLAIGLRTYGIGGALCVAALVGTGAWGGTTFGGVGGEYAGEKIYEAVVP